MTETRKQRVRAISAQLISERSEVEADIRDICDNFIPYRAVWSAGKPRIKRDRKIINNTPVLAVEISKAGMMAGMTSSAKDWFAFTVTDERLRASDAVKSYLESARREVSQAFSMSNWYSALGNAVYPDLTTVGTACVVADELPDGTVNFCQPMIGQYFLGVNELSRVDLFLWKRWFTARQCVGMFGLKACSNSIQEAWSRGDHSTTFEVNLLIMPNEGVTPGAIGPKGKEFSSLWWEESSDTEEFLRVSGYDLFPVFAPRWTKTDGKPWGQGPGWFAVGDARELQYDQEQLRRLRDLCAKPSMKGSRGVKRANTIPGGFTEVPSGDGKSYEPVFMPDPRSLSETRESIAENEDRVERALNVHIWQALINDERAQRRTATEVEASEREKMLMLGPLLENLNPELLEPAVEWMYHSLERRSMLPPLPTELQGTGLAVEFISIAHSMQKRTRMGGTQGFVSEIAALASVRPDALDKLNVDKIVDEFADATGVRPDVVLGEDEVKKIRADRAQRADAKDMGQSLLAATEGARNLGINANPANLQQLASAISPVAAAQGGATPGGVR